MRLGILVINHNNDWGSPTVYYREGETDLYGGRLMQEIADALVGIAREDPYEFGMITYDSMVAEGFKTVFCTDTADDVVLVETKHSYELGVWRLGITVRLHGMTFNQIVTGGRSII